MELRKIHARRTQPYPPNTRHDFKFIHAAATKRSDRQPRITLEDRKPSPTKDQDKKKHIPKGQELEATWTTPILHIKPAAERGWEDEDFVRETETETGQGGKRKEKEEEEEEVDIKATSYHHQHQRVEQKTKVLFKEQREKKEEKKKEKEEEKKEEEKEREARQREKKELLKERNQEKFTRESWLVAEERKEKAKEKTSSGDRQEKGEEFIMTKVAFSDHDRNFTFSQRLNFMPHVVLMVCLAAGTVLILTSVGSSQWMRAQVNGVTIHYGLFERCVTSSSTDVTLCRAFDWPGWLYGSGQEKMNGIKVLAIFSIFFACMFILGALMFLLTSACRPCHGWHRRAFLMVVDICLWLMVTSAGVSSILFLTGMASVQAYPGSTLLWPPVLFCAGWVSCLLSRLIIALCCDVHRDGENTVPFM
ncbi:uncharacterized protein LOC143278008 [Babylonia areolata]|uniref:uncharacterized protein LOC143278008 n=1 Tax=Babylonia areolata TaxID=304850 RepID=UPI003FD0C670